jgi:hypothetical protein
LFGGEDVLLLGSGGVRFGCPVVEGVYGKRPVDSHGFVLVVLIEHDPAAETADARFARLVEHRVGPDVDYSGRRFGLRIGVGPGEGLAEVEFGAAAEGRRKA